MEAIKGRSVDLDKVETTLELLRANAVVGVTGFFDKSTKRMTSMGIQCALCHSTVDDSLMKGIGRRLDGWPIAISTSARSWRRADAEAVRRPARRRRGDRSRRA